MSVSPRVRRLVQWGMMLAWPLSAVPALALPTASSLVLSLGNAEAGRYKVAMCVGCHGIDGYRTAFPEVYRVPKLGGQNAAYLADALRAYRDGARHYDTMRAIAVSLSEQDIVDIAEYYSRQISSTPDNYLK